MSKSTVFEVKTDLPIKQFDDLANKLLGFEARYSRIKKQVQLLLQADELEQWSKQKHGKKLAVIDLLVDQYPLAIFHGDVGTGKTANAEAIVNRLARDARIEDALLKNTTYEIGKSTGFAAGLIVALGKEKVQNYDKFKCDEVVKFIPLDYHIAIVYKSDSKEKIQEKLDEAALLITQEYLNILPPKSKPSA